jgi:hypothetical protein
MKVAVWVLAAMVMLAILGYWLLFPRDRFMILRGPSGASLTFESRSISYEPPPDHYSTNGFDHIETYVSKLLAPSPRSKSILLFTPDGKRGCALLARDGKVEAAFSVEWRQEAVRETAIRSFFSSRGISPTRDYLAGIGGVPDATRMLSYPITGSVPEVTSLTKYILRDLCGVLPSAALNISFTEN